MIILLFLSAWALGFHGFAAYCIAQTYGWPAAVCAELLYWAVDFGVRMRES